jgi:hypothetical protein
VLFPFGGIWRRLLEFAHCDTSVRVAESAPAGKPAGGRVRAEPLHMPNRGPHRNYDRLCFEASGDILVPVRA